MDTRLTAILPVYNGMPFLPKAVESILCQSFTDFDFIIVNDGSIDDSQLYLDSLRDSRIILIRQENAGQGAARNVALQRCRTEYVAVMDQDDISLPERFLSQVKFLDSHPDVVFVGTQFEFLVGEVSQRALAAPLHHDDIEGRLLHGQAGVCHPSLMYRRLAAAACGGYPNGVFGEDIDFCLRMLDYGRAANLGRTLFQYRLHSHQASLSRCKELINANRFAAQKAICRRDGLTQPSYDVFLRDISLFGKLQMSLKAWELTQYRSARINIASHKIIVGAIRLAAVALLNPVAVIRRFAQVIHWRSSDQESLVNKEANM